MIIMALAVAGLCLGSFVNALVWRVHKLYFESNKKPSQKKLQEYSIAKGRSMCPHCKYQLAAKDLIPVVSWLGLKGKCRYCGKRISWQYPAVELLTAALFVISYISWPYGFTGFSMVSFLLWLAVLVLLLALLVFDVRWMRLPTKLIVPATTLTALMAACLAAKQDLKYVLMLMLSVVIIYGLFYGLYSVSDGKWIGDGDVRLAVALGLLAGNPVKAFLLIFVASLLGTLFAVPQLLSKKLKGSSKIAFGPFLITAAILVFLWGTALIEWYTHKILMI